jgi:pyrroloquinoline quinone biosynthesis protein B
VFLIDATPDLREQLDALADVREAPAGRVDRAPVDGILLTHAHMGHYLGLAFLGREAVHSQDLPVWATPRLTAYLTANGPWSQLVRLGNVALRELRPGAEVTLGDGVTATAVAVPHRDEYSDTVAFRLRGPRSTVLYVPDTDSWDAWGEGLAAALAGVDVAIVDGTFHSAAEVPGRSLADIPHPVIGDSVRRFAPAVATGRLRVLFTHLNHTNPALEPASPERRALEAAGFAVLAEGQELPL